MPLSIPILSPMTAIKATNITWHEGHVTREEREALLKQKGATLWFTGLSGSGKSTLAFTLEHALCSRAGWPMCSTATTFAMG